MDDAKLREWWSYRQGLDGTLDGKTSAEVLANTGWARSVGGSGPYLGLYARSGISREAIDASVAALEIHELPAARGCTYVLPAGDYALGLKVGQPFRGAEMKTAMKLGVTEAEIDKLCDAVLKALGRGPLDPEQLKEAVGPAARSLGPEGINKGTGNTMPVALGKLQASGEIRRVPVNGRLDQQRYRYTQWTPNPLAAFRMSVEESNIELARRYFRWIGPATLSEFQWFSGLGVKAAKEATQPLKLTSLPESPDRLMFDDDHEAFKRFRIPKEPQYALVAGLDAITLLRRDLSQIVAEEDRAFLVDSGAAWAGGLTDLPSHAILDRGRIIGLWEYDPEAGCLAWRSFRKPDKELKAALARTEEYVREQLGDARSFSLDSPKSRIPRIEALRKAQRAGI